MQLFPHAFPLWQTLQHAGGSGSGAPRWVGAVPAPADAVIPTREPPRARRTRAGTAVRDGNAGRERGAGTRGGNAGRERGAGTRTGAAGRERQDGSGRLTRPRSPITATDPVLVAIPNAYGYRYGPSRRAWQFPSLRSRPHRGLERLRQGLWIRAREHGFVDRFLRCLLERRPDRGGGTRRPEETSDLVQIGILPVRGA